MRLVALCLVITILLGDLHRAVILQNHGIGEVPDITFNVEGTGGEKECTYVIAEGELRRIYVLVRFDHVDEVQSSIGDFFMSFRVVESDISGDYALHKCFQLGGYNYYESDCEYVGMWPEAIVFSPHDNPLEVANYYLDFTDIVFGLSGEMTVNSSIYEICLGNGWLGSLERVRYHGDIVFSDSGWTLTALPPTISPTATPSAVPSASPSRSPISPYPTLQPSIMTLFPTSIDYIPPTHSPSVSIAPSFTPSTLPSTSKPTSSPPSSSPSSTPSRFPTLHPSACPSTGPTATLAPTFTPILVDSLCLKPQSIIFDVSLDALQSQCIYAPMIGHLISLNVSLVFTREESSFTESPADLAVVFFNTATGSGVQVGGTMIVDDRVSVQVSWPESWSHMHVSSGILSSSYSAIVNLSALDMEGENVYSMCMTNSYHFSEGVRYGGSILVDGMQTSCNISLPVPSSPPTLSPSLSLAPTQGKRQILRHTQDCSVGVEPDFSFDALLSGGESICVDTCHVAGAPTEVAVQLQCSYMNNMPGASWASDFVLSVTNSGFDIYGNRSDSCAYITGDSSNIELKSCFLGGTWPTLMNSGLNNFVYSNISVNVVLAGAVARNLGEYNKRQLCIGNGFLQSENVHYMGTVAFVGMVAALPPTMAPTHAANTQRNSRGSVVVDASVFILAILIFVTFFISMLVGVYIYRCNKVVYHRGIQDADSFINEHSHSEGICDVDESSNRFPDTPHVTVIPEDNSLARIAPSISSLEMSRINERQRTPPRPKWWKLITAVPPVMMQSKSDDTLIHKPFQRNKINRVHPSNSSPSLLAKEEVDDAKFQISSTAPKCSATRQVTPAGIENEELFPIEEDKSCITSRVAPCLDNFVEEHEIPVTLMRESNATLTNVRVAPVFEDQEIPFLQMHSHAVTDRSNSNRVAPQRQDIFVDSEETAVSLIHSGMMENFTAESASASHVTHQRDRKLAERETEGVHAVPTFANSSNRILPQRVDMFVDNEETAVSLIHSGNVVVSSETNPSQRNITRVAPLPGAANNTDTEDEIIFLEFDNNEKSDWD